MTSRERVSRNSELFAQRARGMTWPALAAQFELSERQCRRIVDDIRTADHSFTELDPLVVVRELLDAYEAAAEDLAVLSTSTTHDGTRLGAIRARIEVARYRTELLQSVGVIPHDLGQLTVLEDAQMVATAIKESLDRAGVSREVQLEIASSVEMRSADTRDQPV